MRSVLLQPSYIPWRGYFHQIFKAELFVHYDDAQYDKHGWRNRNQIRNKNGEHWLTIPALAKGNIDRGLAINEIRINNSSNWAKKHWQTLEQSYSKTRFFSDYAAGLKAFYDNPPDLLVDFTIPLLEHLAGLLGIKNTRFIRSSSLECQGVKTGKIVEILEKIGSTHYISGPSARNYMDEDLLKQKGIVLEYMEYSYPEYPSCFPGQLQSLSIVDLLFQTGPNAPDYIWGSCQQQSGPARFVA